MLAPQLPEFAHFGFKPLICRTFQLRRVRKIALRGAPTWHGVRAILRTLPASRMGLQIRHRRTAVAKSHEMVRQDADGVRCEWPARLDRTINLPQAFDMYDKKRARPVSKHKREKEHPAFDVWAPISRHRRMMI